MEEEKTKEGSTRSRGQWRIRKCLTVGGWWESSRKG
jgi:hypothetical protein